MPYIFQPRDSFSYIVGYFLWDTPRDHLWEICITRICFLMSPLVNTFTCGKFTKINHKISVKDEKNKDPKSAIVHLKCGLLGEVSSRWGDPASSFILDPYASLRCPQGFLQHHDGPHHPGFAVGTSLSLSSPLPQHYRNQLFKMGSPESHCMSPQQIQVFEYEYLLR